MLFDLKLNYLGCSPMLKKYFPDVTHVQVDKQIDPRGNKIIEKSVNWLKYSVMTGEKEPLYITQMGLRNLRYYSGFHIRTEALR